MDDAELVQRAATGDTAAFALVYDRYSGRIHDFLSWVLQDRDDADNALYYTFLDAGARIHELEDGSKLRTWLFAIAGHQAHRHGSTRRRAAPPAVAPGGETSWDELVEVVRAASSDLTLRERVLLDLRHRQGLQGQDLADAIGTDAEQAHALVDGLTDRVERVVGDSVVAYLGAKDCAELKTLLGDFGGRLDDAQRETVETHAQTCARCGPRRRRKVGAPALFGVTPAPPIPVGLSQRVLDDVELASHNRLPFLSRRRGFPPRLGGERDVRWRIVAVAGTIAVVGALALLLTRDDGKEEQVASVGSTVASTTSTRLTTSTRPASTTSSSIAPDAGVIGAAPTTAARSSGGTGDGSTGGGGTTGSGDGAGSGAGTTEPPAPEPTAPAEVTTTAPPPTAPPDRTGPALSGLTVSPRVVKAGSRCTNGDPAQATVSVSATDPSGVRAVLVTVAGAGGGQTAMTPTGGGNYSATVGPFTSPLPAGADFTVQVLVQATDNADNPNVSTDTAPLTLRCTA